MVVTMANYVVVSNKNELERALENKGDKIIVTDPNLARSISVIKYAARAVLNAVIAGMGVAATNFWNPIGVTAGIAASAIAGSTVTAIVALEVSAVFLFAMYNDCDIKAKGSVKIPDGTEVEGEVILSRK
jgi:hypothetical protein